MTTSAKPFLSPMIALLALLACSAVLVSGLSSGQWCRGDTSAPDMVSFPSFSHVHLLTRFVYDKPSEKKGMNAYKGVFEVKAINMMPLINDYHMEVIGIFYQTSGYQIAQCDNFLASSTVLTDFSKQKENTASGGEMDFVFGHDVGSMIYLVKTNLNQVYAIRSKIELVQRGAE